MKKNKKIQFSARKSLLGIFVLLAGLFSLSPVFADLTLECAEKTTFVGCTLKQQCVWYDNDNNTGTKCIPRAEKTDIKLLSLWEQEDCRGENYVQKEFEADCVDRVTIEESPCDNPEWLNDAGKRKCRRYFDLVDKYLDEECREQVEFIWQSSLKDSNARYLKQEGMAQCNNSLNNFLYEGPVFNGPGLRGGAQLAQIELSDSISKQRDIKALLIDWSQFAIEIALVLAVIALIWAGIRYITDLGDGSGVEAAKKIILWTIVGILIILGSYAIVNTVINARFGSDLAYNVINTLII